MKTQDPEAHLLDRVATHNWEALSPQDQALATEQWGSEAAYRAKRQAVLATQMAMAAPAPAAGDMAGAWQRLAAQLPAPAMAPAVASSQKKPKRIVWWAAAVLIAGVGFGAGWWSRPGTPAQTAYALVRDTVYIPHTVRDTVAQNTVQTVYQLVMDCPQPTADPKSETTTLGKSYPVPVQAPPQNALLFAEARLGANQYGISLADDSARHRTPNATWELMPLGM